MKKNLVRVTKKLSYAGVIGGFIATSAAFALDSLPMVPGDSSSVGKTSSAKLLNAGGIRAGVLIEGADIVKLNNDKARDSSYGSGHQAFANVSYGVLKDLELGLSFKMNREIMFQDSRDDLFENNSHYEVGYKKFKETGYAGTRGMLKYRLIQNGGLNISIATYAEEGMGERGMYALTKAQKAAQGWLALLSYGYKGVGEININTGMRYQKPQLFDNRYFRNEMMARVNVTGYFMNDFGLFTTLGGRRLMVADATVRGPDSKLIYTGEDSAEVLGGLVADIGLTKVSVYGGADLKKVQGFGSAQHTYGLSISTKVGTKLRDRDWEAKVKRRSHESSESSEAKNVVEISEPVNAAATDVNAYPEMKGNVDPLSQSGGADDDFDRVRAKMKRQHVTRKSGMTEQEEVEKELETLRAAETQVANDKLTRAKATEQRQRSVAKAKSKQTSKKNEELRRKTREELDDEYGISTEETKWKGLE
jgi:hypothetical protein